MKSEWSGDKSLDGLKVIAIFLTGSIFGALMLSVFLAVKKSHEDRHRSTPDY